MTYLLILIMTIFVATRANLMYENITGVATIADYHLLVVIFTIICAGFFAYKMYRVLILLHHQESAIKLSIIVAASMMIIGAFCPYTLNGKDFYSMMHVICSMVPSLIFLILLFIYTRFLAIQYPHIYLHIHWFFDLGIQFLCLLLIVFTRVNGYLEIYFTILVCGYLYIMEKSIKKEVIHQEDF